MLWYFKDLIIGVILGFVEGITEFLPISSTGHMIIVAEKILHILQGPRVKTFEVVVQLGSIFAVIFLFKERILTLLGFDIKKKTRILEGNLNIAHIFLAIFPAAIIGFFFHSFIKSLFSTKTVIAALIMGSILMLVAEKISSNLKNKTVYLDEISYSQAFTIGLFQCFALWPGFSRAGATISGGLIAGVKHKAASEFSFIIAIPMMIGASALDLVKNFSFLSLNDLPFFIAGFVTSFLVAIFAIKFFLNIISNINLVPFAIYRFIVAFVLLFI